VALESFDGADEALDTQTVLWAVRGMSAARGGVSAEDVARFLSKDATLSAPYDPDDVAVLLDSLVIEGTLTYDSTRGVWSTDDVLGHAFADPGWGSEAGSATTMSGTEADAFLRLRVEELERERIKLERERTEIGAERDEWRRRAESAEEDASCAHTLGEELRARVRELEHLLHRERAAGDERSDTTRRAAVALARAQRELERLESEEAGPDAGAGPRVTAPPLNPPRKTLRGNWLL
jgi:hypothetical protein